MCGITGVVDFENRQAARHIQAMTQTLRHRGPDGEGYALFYPEQILEGRGEETPPAFAHLPPIENLASTPAQVALGHRRLSILDLSTNGHNPLPNQDRTLWISYNGEVFNYLELRAELLTLGYSFRSGTDTEVILAAYEHWGVACLSRFNGMFAFAIWDTRKQRLFCARDRFGIKPFYFSYQNGYLAFASEIKALLANPQVEKCASRQAIYDYLVNGAISGTFFEGIEQLQGGEALWLTAEGQLNRWSYYNLTFQSHLIERDYARNTEKFRDLLLDAVRLRLRSDVPVGSSLSGGLDSSSVVSLANQLLQTEGGIQRELVGTQQKVFCAVYYGETFDEKPYMDELIHQTGVSAFFTRPDSHQLWEDLEKLVWHQDEPFNSTAIFAQYCVMRLAHQTGVTVLLDGQGGDETLGGYPFYYGYFLAQLMRVGRLWRVAEESLSARRNGNVGWNMLGALTAWNMGSEGMRRQAWKWGGSKMLSNKPISTDLVQTDFWENYHREAQLKHKPFPSLAKKLRDDVLQSNLPVLLRYEDRNSMAFQIEARVPYLDYRLVDFVFTLGADARIRHGWSKAILRDAMQGQIPETIRLRRDKEGYTTPHERWLRELTPQINALFSGDIRAQQYLSPHALQQLRSSEAGVIQGVWRLINLESWLRAFDLS